MGQKRMNPMQENILLRKHIATLERDVYILKGFTLQQALDVLLITMNQDFGWGPVRNARLEKKFKETFMTVAKMALEDDKDDDQINYTKGKMDRLLQRACGPNILSWEERYDTAMLYIKDRDAGKDGQAAIDNSQAFVDRSIFKELPKGV